MQYIKKISKALLLLLLPVLIGACAGLGSSSYTVRISSTPSEATVIANGTEIGKTPMVITPDQAFPPKWQGMAYQSAGTLALKKTGCKDYFKAVNDSFLSKDIHITLECSGEGDTRTSADPGVTEGKDSKPKEMKAPPASSGSMKGGYIEQRLTELQRMYKKGLITEDEYQATKKRILNEL